MDAAWAAVDVARARRAEETIAAVLKKTREIRTSHPNNSWKGTKRRGLSLYHASSGEINTVK